MGEGSAAVGDHENPHLGVPKVVPILVSFWNNFGSQHELQNGPKMDPKVNQNLIFFVSIFGSLFFEVLELFGCLLGAFLGLLRLSWEATGPQKH